MAIKPLPENLSNSKCLKYSDMKKLKLIALYTCLFTLLFVAANAQGPGFDDDVEDTPFDGGASLLVIAGAAYGFKKLREMKPKK